MRKVYNNEHMLAIRHVLGGDAVREQRPIGYWLKHLDRLIERTFERSLADQGLSRRDWQTMNVLSAGPHDAEGLAAALRPFWGEGAVALDEVVGGLERRGWISPGADRRFALTALGLEAHRAVSERVQETRRRSLEGLTEGQYRAAVDTLRRMTENLEAFAA
jgi:hypothetical protein